LQYLSLLRLCCWLAILASVVAAVVSQLIKPIFVYRQARMEHSGGFSLVMDIAVM